MKTWMIQIVCMTVVLACTVTLNALMLTYCVEHHCIEYVHAVLSCTLMLIAVIATKVLCDLAREHREELDGVA